ncbi:UDP-glycosyltransferase UGT39B1 [Operophtera brumata]|uniref:UDP-glycosyltransferase UGT39B1 n=1 Tax=Operophtera brumata TaxID=104452 RepID=A0A0L7LWH9_OPEBR|nr:UDP-glycosyltransferase UGT39B1 [Operophtera brumata]
MLRPIGLELARRGHNVTVITAYKEENPPPTYRQVIVDNKLIWDVLGIERPNVFDMVQISAEEFHDMILFRGGLGTTETALNSTEVKGFLAEDNSFDLVISEQFFQESLYILAHKYKTPLVLVTTFGNCMRHNIVTRNPLQLATTISEFLDLKEPTSFRGRLRNLYFIIYEYVYWRYWYLEKQEALVKKYIPNLPEPVPSLYEMQKNASLILVNGHFSVDLPVAYLPNVVEIGGVHLSKSDSKLPDDLQQLLDEATNGVVYVNFGSNVRSSELPVEKRDAFLNVFRKLKHTVLWKWEDDNLPNKPDNLVVENLGFGRILQYNDINEQSLGNHLDEFLRDDTYKRKAVEASERFKDRPMSALDSAMFWIEYVIRHKGAKHMKSPAMELSWIAYSMIDVYAFILMGILLVAYVLYKIVKFSHYSVLSLRYSKMHKKKQN